MKKIPPQEWLVWHGDDVCLQLQIQPRARKTEIVGINNQYLKIKLAALPAENAANVALIKFLAKIFNVRQKEVILLQGATSRYKIIKIIKPEKIPNIIQNFLKMNE